MYATAPAPARATSSITLSAGMLSIPLSLYTGTESTRVERHEFFQGDASIPLGRSTVRKDNGDKVEQADVTRMAEASNGTWVVLTDDEIAACMSEERGVAEIVSLVSVKDFDQYLTEALYQVRPKAKNPSADKAFALLLAGMKARKCGALVKVALRGTPRYAILTTDGDLRMILTADAVRQPLPLADFKFSKAEVDMATTFIDALGINATVVTDETAPVVQAYVDSKAGGAPTKATKTVAATSDDLMAALQASIDAAVAAKAAKVA